MIKSIRLEDEIEKEWITSGKREAGITIGFLILFSCLIIIIYSLLASRNMMKSIENSNRSQESRTVGSKFISTF